DLLSFEDGMKELCDMDVNHTNDNTSLIVFYISLLIKLKKLIH
ncbi:unnamed protein product, partial [Heterotrigona itama]